jgi:DUF4097 and DUF4098 domain-containing protein YvlB
MTMKTLATPLIAIALVVATEPTRAETIRESRPAAADGRIELSAATGDFDVIGHDAEEFVLEGRLGDEVEELIIEGEASNWRIELEPVDGKVDWRSGSRASELTLRVPRGSDLELTTRSGDLMARDLAGPDLDIESVSGDVALERIASAAIEVQTVSGDIEAEGISAKTSEYQSVSGDMELRGARGRIDIQTVSGDVELEAGAVADFESESVSGDLEADLSPEPGAPLKVSSHSGDLELHLRIDHTPRIRAETYSGSIDSDFGESEEAGFGAGETLTVEGGADAVEIEAETFSGSVTIRRAD